MPGKGRRLLHCVAPTGEIAAVRVCRGSQVRVPGVLHVCPLRLPVPAECQGTAAACRERASSKGEDGQPPSESCLS